MTDGYLVLAMVAVFLLVAEVSKLSFQNFVLARENRALHKEVFRLVIRENLANAQENLLREIGRGHLRRALKYGEEAHGCNSQLTECTHEAAAFKANVTELLRNLRVELDEKAQNTCADSRGMPFFTTALQLYTAPPCTAFQLYRAPAPCWAYPMLLIGLFTFLALAFLTVKWSKFRSENIRFRVLEIEWLRTPVSFEINSSDTQEIADLGDELAHTVRFLEGIRRKSKSEIFFQRREILLLKGVIAVLALCCAALIAVVVWLVL